MIAHLVQVPRDEFLSETIIFPLLPDTHKIILVRTPFTLAPFIDYLLQSGSILGMFSVSSILNCHP